MHPTPVIYRGCETLLGSSYDLGFQFDIKTVAEQDLGDFSASSSLTGDF